MDPSDEAFFREAQSQIQALNEGLIALDRDSDGEAVVDELFRVAHSLKGACGLQGLSAAGDLAHALEDVLADIRGGHVEPTSPLINEALEAVDQLETIIQAAASGGDADCDIDPDATRASLRSTLEEQRAQTTAADVNTGEQASRTRDDDRDLSDDGLSDDVVALLEETTEFDELNSGLNEKDTTPADDDLDGWGLLDDAAVAAAPQMAGDAEDADTADDPTAFFEETKDELDDEAELDALQDAIHAIEFSEFDDDNYTIDELIDLDPAEDPPGADDAAFDEITDDTPAVNPVSSDELVSDDQSNTESSIETVDSLIEPEGGGPNESAAADAADTTDRDSVEPATEESPPPAREADHPTDVTTNPADESEPVEVDTADLPEDSMDTSEQDWPGETDEEDATNVFIFGDEREDDTLSPEEEPGETAETGAEAEPAAAPDDDVTEAEGVSGAGPEASESAGDLDDILTPELPDASSRPEADVPDPDSVPEMDLDVEQAAAPTPDIADDSGDDPQLDVAIDEEMEAFESRFDELFDEEPGENDEQTAEPTYQSAVGTLEESRLDAGDFPAADDSTEPEGTSGFDRLQTMTVDVETADQLLHVAEELSLTHLRLDEALGPDTDDDICEEVATLQNVITEYRQTVVDVRLMPLKTAVETIPRTVRDIAQSQDKDVEVITDETDVKLDRDIIDQLRDPLVHIARNAVDHGIESPDDRTTVGKPPEATIEIRAERAGTDVIIEVSDDGRGIDPEAIRQQAVDNGVLTREEADQLTRTETYELLFEPGFTTREEVTDVSGRGVGMDVVRRTVADLNGTVSVESEPGEGTTVRLTVPVSVVFTEVLFVEANGETFGIPMTVVEQITPTPSVRTIDGQEVVRPSDLDLVGGLPDSVEADDSYPLVRLRSALNLSESETQPDDDGQLVWARADTSQLAIRCDRVVASQEVVVRPYGALLRDVPGISGATTLGDGEAVNVLDVESL